MAAPKLIVGLERAWRALMRHMGHDHPALVMRNRIVIRTLHDRMKQR